MLSTSYRTLVSLKMYLHLHKTILILPTVLLVWEVLSPRGIQMSATLTSANITKGQLFSQSMEMTYNLKCFN